MGCQKRRNTRDVLDRPNVWFSPSPRLFLFANPLLILAWSNFSLASSPSTRGLPPPYWCGFVHGPRRGFLVSPQFERVAALFSADQAAFPRTPSHFPRLADGQPSHSGPGLTSSYSHRLDGRCCQYRNPKIRPSLGFLQNRHKLISLPQEATDHIQIPLSAVPERFAHRAL